MNEIQTLHNKSQQFIQDKIETLKENLDNDLLDLDCEIAKIKQKKKRLQRECKDKISQCENEIEMNETILEHMSKTIDASSARDEDASLN
jgi:uncharacterized protein (DUF342 family)